MATAANWLSESTQVADREGERETETEIDSMKLNERTARWEWQLVMEM